VGAGWESPRPSVDGKASRQRSLKQQSKREALLSYRNRFAEALKAELVRLPLQTKRMLLALTLSFMYNAYVQYTCMSLFVSPSLYTYLHWCTLLSQFGWFSFFWP
jgi:hypothetical protein